MQFESNYASDLFDQFLAANTLRTVTSQFKRICNFLDIQPGSFDTFYPSLKKGITNNWKAQTIFNKLDKKASNKIYLNNSKEHKILKSQKCLIIGGGPCGLRTAIELQLLGADHVLIVEKRDRISRNNVVHLWPLCIHDLKDLAGKKLYSKFCAGSIDHISIRQLQLMLLKDNVAFEQLCPLNFRNCEANEECCCNLHHSTSSDHRSTAGNGAFAHYIFNQTSNYPELVNKLNTYAFNILIGADGRRNLLNNYFPRKEFRGRLAIAITVNFINNHTLAEAQASEISGISFIYYQQLFKSLNEQLNIDLENICYYKDDTHYFVMTAKKASLLARGVLIEDFQDTRALLSPENINQNELLNYAKDAAKWTTGLDNLKFALNHYGTEDVAMFDFTSMYAAENACRFKEIYSRTKCCKQETDLTRDGLLLTALVGDSLLEPFWPTGSGCGRGFLSSMDTAWLCRQYAIKCLNNNSKNILKDNEESILSVISERESIYRLLAQTKPENLNQNFSHYNLNPITRYPNLNSVTIMPHQCKHLIYSNVKRTMQQHKQTLAEKRLRRITIACTPETFKQQFMNKQQQEEINESPEDESSFNNHNSNLNSNNGISYKNQMKLTGKEYLANNRQYLTPSAFNLASLEKSRNKEIESVIRHRKQREERLNQECLTSEERFMNHIRKQIKPKTNWLLNHNTSNINAKQENSYESNTSSNKSNNSSQEDLPGHYSNHFSSKVQDLEYKLSNRSQFNEERYLRNQNSNKHVDGVNVMVARLALQDLLDPRKQEEKLREEVKRKSILEKDFECKFVGKLKDDWNFKLFNSTSSEDNDKLITNAQTTNKLDRSVSLKQRPKERLALFKDKLKNIENILTNGKSKTDDEVNRLTKKQLQKFEQKQSNGKCGEWIEKLKGELNDKLNDKPKPRSFIKKRSSISQMHHSSSNQDTSSHSTNSYFKKPNIEYIKYEKMTKPTITAIKQQTTDYLNSSSLGATNYHSLDRSAMDKLKQNKFDSYLRMEANRPTYMKDDCTVCKNKVLTVDKILINGLVFHRTCINCRICGMSLKLSEVRHINNAFDDKNCICTLCSNENRLTRSNSTSNYSDKLKERIKLKEIYLLNSLGVQQDANGNQINERIEYGYENTSLTNHDLLDDEEVTKLLNLNLDTKDVCSKSSQSSVKSENSDEDEEEDEDEEDEDESSSESTSTLDDQTTGADVYSSDQFDNSISEQIVPEIIVDKSTDNNLNDSDSRSKDQEKADETDDEPTLNEAINELQDLTDTINDNDQSIDQSNDQSNNQSTNQLTDQPSNQPFGQLSNHNQQNQPNKTESKFIPSKMISDINEVMLDEEDDLLANRSTTDEVRRTEKSNSIGNFNLKVEIPKTLQNRDYSDFKTAASVLRTQQNETRDSNQQLNKPRLGSYCGSFTEKVLKCKSSPSLNDNLSFTSFYSNASSSSFKK